MFGCLLLSRRLNLVNNWLGVDASSVKPALVREYVLHVVFTEGIRPARRGSDAHHRGYVLPLLILRHLDKEER